MTDSIKLHYLVDGNDFISAGEASADVKRVMKQIGIDAATTRKVSIAMYEGEINMVIHAGGGEADVTIEDNKVTIILTDYGPGIKDVSLAMTEGYSTAPDNVRSLGFGAGMGLPNMKRYTDEMEIKTAPNAGTTVKMTILISDATSIPD